MTIWMGYAKKVPFCTLQGGYVVSDGKGDRIAKTAKMTIWMGYAKKVTFCTLQGGYVVS